MDTILSSLIKLEHIEELYEVTGEFSIVTLVSADDIEKFRGILKNKIMKIKGVKSTISSIVLRAHKGPKCTLGQYLQTCYSLYSQLLTITEK